MRGRLRNDMMSLLYTEKRRNGFAPWLSKRIQDRLIEEKKDLAERIVGSGEGWLAELADRRPTLGAST